MHKSRELRARNVLTLLFLRHKSSAACITQSLRYTRCATTKLARHAARLLYPRVRELCYLIFVDIVLGGHPSELTNHVLFAIKDLVAPPLSAVCTQAVLFNCSRKSSLRSHEQASYARGGVRWCCGTNYLCAFPI